jgi:transposase
VLIGWLAWAQRCRLEPFVKLAKTIKRYRKLMLELCLPRPD